MEIAQIIRTKNISSSEEHSKINNTGLLIVGCATETPKVYLVRILDKNILIKEDRETVDKILAESAVTGINCSYELIEPHQMRTSIEQLKEEGEIEVVHIIEQMTPAQSRRSLLMEKQMELMGSSNVLISVYKNALGYLWELCKNDSGTNLGWSECSGDDEHSGTFTSYELALESAIYLVCQLSPEEYKKRISGDFHWQNYANYLITNCKHLRETE